MNLNNIQYCPSTLEPGYTTYSPKALKDLFGSRTKKVSHVLSFPAPGKDEEQTKEYNEKRKGISISGYQEKYSLRLNNSYLDLVDTGGQYILKPVPAERLLLVDDLPANEHLTMQIASQVYKIETASNALIFFEDGTPAYLTKRFDYKPDGTKYQIEDFATLLGCSPQTDAGEFKIKASYTDIACVIDQYVPAAKLEKIKFFTLVVFNYLFSNGDAHLKNFSLLETSDGDYVLSPAYDLVCTALHIDDGNLALQGGLYEKDYESPAFQKYGFYTYADFVLFAEKIGIGKEIAEKILQQFQNVNGAVLELIQRSFLSDRGKQVYEKHYRDRCSTMLMFL
jgi:serine/threonine-protein kinase HipA